LNSQPSFATFSSRNIQHHLIINRWIKIHSKFPQRNLDLRRQRKKEKEKSRQLFFFLPRQQLLFIVSKYALKELEISLLIGRQNIASTQRGNKSSKEWQMRR
jgi:hypothetical protein